MSWAIPRVAGWVSAVVASTTVAGCRGQVTTAGEGSAATYARDGSASGVDTSATPKCGASPRLLVDLGAVVAKISSRAHAALAYR